jgi:putative tryptophan/tyrosine transport system substrate-binding protein
VRLNLLKQTTVNWLKKSSAKRQVLLLWVGSIVIATTTAAITLQGCSDRILQSTKSLPMQIAYVDMDLPATLADITKLRSLLNERGLDTSGFRFFPVAQLGEPERLTLLTEKIAEFGPSLILATGTNEARTLNRAFPDIPMLFLSPADPRRAGLTTALSEPEKNASGISFYQPVEGKQLELLKLCMPQLKSVAVLVDQSVTEATELAIYETVGAELNVDVKLVWLEFETDATNALRKLRASAADAWLIPASHSAIKHRETLLKHFKEKRVPVLWTRTKVLSLGGTFAYDDNLNDWHTVWAKQVQLISQGITPAAIPIERPTGFDFGLSISSVAKLPVPPPKACLLRANLFVD